MSQAPEQTRVEQSVMQGRGGGMDAACKDTPIRSSVVPFAALYPKRHHHDRTYLTAFAKFYADHLREKEETEKKTNMPRVSLWPLCPRLKRVDSVSFENDEIFSVKSEVAACTSKSHEFCLVHTWRSEGLTKLGHEADNRDTMRIEVFFSPDTFDNAAGQLIK